MLFLYSCQARYALENSAIFTLTSQIRSAWSIKISVKNSLNWDELNPFIIIAYFRDIGYGMFVEAHWVGQSMTDAFLSGSNFLILICLTMIIDCFLFVIFFCSISIIFKSLSKCLSFFTVVLVIVQANDFVGDCSQSLYLNINSKI